MSFNRLSSEKSPYLKQHAGNPVWWYSWGEEAFAAARDQQKPIFLSIGYSTCYWCHVMEKDSFEQQEVAAVLNEFFISIKVDREERPDVDRIYMDTVVALTGHGGWPLSVALTPDLKPYWAGTFFYKEQFLNVLKALARAWREENTKVIESASEIAAEISREQEKSTASDPSRQAIEQAVANLMQGFDSSYGGFGSAPKFPPPFQLGLLMRFAISTKDSAQANAARKILSKTLACMIASGIHDQIGGGFHRYATDEKWLIPHFEKMLYDNAQLCHVLAEAYQFTGNQTYLDAAKGCADYVIRDMQSPEGAFYAAQDAGEVGKEGDFYVFKYEEIKNLLSEEDFSLLLEVFDFTKSGNFEHGNNIFAQRAGLCRETWINTAGLRKKLFEIRSKRQRPLTDTKILCSWNALMIRALVKLYEASLDPQYLAAAEKTAGFIQNNLWKSDRLFRRYSEGEAGISACLEDYAFLVEALLDLFCITAKQIWFEAALNIQEAQDKQLWNHEKEVYLDSSAPELISRKVEVNDGATAAGNSVAAKNLIVISRLTANPALLEKARKVLLKFSDTFERYPHAACRALQALDLFSAPSSEIVLSRGIDGQAENIEQFLSKKFLPNSIQVRLGDEFPTNKLLEPLLAGKVSGDKSLLYACCGHVCLAPLAWPEISGM